MHWYRKLTRGLADGRPDPEDIRASYGIADADLAESYVVDAIDFAKAAIDEAESAALNAMYSRSRAALLSL
jgi:hypothetical protein